jgi:hypothetical protein
MNTKKYTVKLERWAAAQPENDWYSVETITGPTVRVPYSAGEAGVGDLLSEAQANWLGSVATLTIKRPVG